MCKLWLFNAACVRPFRRGGEGRGAGRSPICAIASGSGADGLEFEDVLKPVGASLVDFSSEPPASRSPIRGRPNGPSLARAHARAREIIEEIRLRFHSSTPGTT